MKLPEVYTHTCPCCHTSFGNEVEYLEICQNCLKEHGVDTYYLEKLIPALKKQSKQRDRDLRHLEDMFMEIMLAEEKMRESEARVKKSVKNAKKWRKYSYATMVFYFIWIVVYHFILGY